MEQFGALGQFLPFIGVIIVFYFFIVGIKVVFLKVPTTIEWLVLIGVVLNHKLKILYSSVPLSMAGAFISLKNYNEI